MNYTERKESVSRSGWRELEKSSSEGDGQGLKRRSGSQREEKGRTDPRDVVRSGM